MLWIWNILRQREHKKKNIVEDKKKLIISNIKIVVMSFLRVWCFFQRDYLKIRYFLLQKNFLLAWAGSLQFCRLKYLVSANTRSLKWRFGLPFLLECCGYQLKILLAVALSFMRLMCPSQRYWKIFTFLNSFFQKTLIPAQQLCIFSNTSPPNRITDRIIDLYKMVLILRNAQEFFYRPK